MIWIIGEYAERIDNADELLENFLDGFHDENTQVSFVLLYCLALDHVAQSVAQCMCYKFEVNPVICSVISDTLIKLALAVLLHFIASTICQ